MKHIIPEQLFDLLTSLALAGVDNREDVRGDRGVIPDCIGHVCGLYGRGSIPACHSLE